MIQKDGVAIEMIPDNWKRTGTLYRRVTFSQKKSFLYTLIIIIIYIIIYMGRNRIYG